MKSSPLNTGDRPSVSSVLNNPCFDSESQIAALEAQADDGISYLLPYSHFLYAKRDSNPALEKEPDAPPERMLIHFARGEVVVLGSGLERLERAIQGFELKSVKSADRRLAATLKTHVAAVTITFTEDVA